MAKNCEGSGIRGEFFDKHKVMITNWKQDVKSLIRENENQIRHMIANWTSSEDAIGCLKDRRFPYHSYSEETNFLVISRLVKEIQSIGGKIVGPKRNWLDEMAHMLIKMKSKLDMDKESCATKVKELENATRGSGSVWRKIVT